jgi:hypothetical protein
MLNGFIDSVRTGFPYIRNAPAWVCGVFAIWPEMLLCREPFQDELITTTSVTIIYAPTTAFNLTMRALFGGLILC